MSYEGTTIVAVRKDGLCAMAGDGQVTSGQHTILKMNAKKVRRLYHDQVIVGFAGSVADAFTLCERFEGKLEQFSGILKRAAVELAQDWREDKILRRLEAMLLAADRDALLVISGSGEVIDPDDGIAAIGSGGNFALAAAKARCGRIPICRPPRSSGRPSASPATSAYSPIIRLRSRRWERSGGHERYDPP